MVILVQDDSGSVLSYYTEEEKLLSFETGWQLPNDELQERVEIAFQEWLVSDKRMELIQDKLNVVIDYYPNITFDYDLLNETANTIEVVRDKFDQFRELNINSSVALFFIRKVFKI